MSVVVAHCIDVLTMLSSWIHLPDSSFHHETLWLAPSHPGVGVAQFASIPVPHIMPSIARTLSFSARKQFLDTSQHPHIHDCPYTLLCARPSGSSLTEEAIDVLFFHIVALLGKCSRMAGFECWGHGRSSAGWWSPHAVQWATFEQQPLLFHLSAGISHSFSLHNIQLEDVQKSGNAMQALRCNMQNECSIHHLSHAIAVQSHNSLTSVHVPSIAVLQSFKGSWADWFEIMATSVLDFQIFFDLIMQLLPATNLHLCCQHLMHQCLPWLFFITHHIHVFPISLIIICATRLLLSILWWNIKEELRGSDWFLSNANGWWLVTIEEELR